MLGIVAARWKEQFSESAQAVRTAAANPNIRRLELAWMCSISGLWTYTIALSVFAYEEGGATAVGLVGAIRLFPAAIAAPFAAGLGDRFPRERVRHHWRTASRPPATLRRYGGRRGTAREGECRDRPSLD